MYLCRYRCTYSMRHTYIHTYIYVCLLMCFSLYNFLFVQIGLYAASLIRIGHVLKFILAPPPRAARPPVATYRRYRVQTFWFIQRVFQSSKIACCVFCSASIYRPRFGSCFYDQLLLVFLFIFRYFCLTCRLWRFSIAVVYIIAIAYQLDRHFIYVFSCLISVFFSTTGLFPVSLQLRISLGGPYAILDNATTHTGRLYSCSTVEATPTRIRNYLSVR